jgi:hypothetical protein
MPEFHTHHALTEAGERNEQLSEGNKLVPISAAIIAVFAALATLFSNHSSVSGLEKRTLAGIYQTRAADGYSYYESSRIKIEVNQAIVQSGLVPSSHPRDAINARINKEQSKSAATLTDAQHNEEISHNYLDEAEKTMSSYEHFEWAATLFEVAVVLVSITALARTRVLMYVGFLATAVGLVFFGMGFF